MTLEPHPNPTATATDTFRSGGNTYHVLPFALPKQKIRLGGTQFHSIDPR